MASLAVAKIIAAESAFTIVAGEAALRAWIGEVLCRGGLAHLARLRQPAPLNLMTTRAIQTLARAVVGVTESERVGTRTG